MSSSPQFVELRQSAEARQFLLQSYLLQQVEVPSGEHVRPVFEWTYEVLVTGTPIPSVGLVADLGHLLFNTEFLSRTKKNSLPNFPSEMGRRYEDLLLGRYYLDPTFERAAMGVQSYSDREDRRKALAFLTTQLVKRSGMPGVVLSPGILKSLLRENSQDLLEEAWQSVTEYGWHRMLLSFYESMIEAIRNAGPFWGKEESF